MLAGPDHGGQRELLERQARRLGVGHAVDFVGSLSRDELAKELRIADMYVQLSRYDAFPVSVVEALLAGKPVLLSTKVGMASFDEIASLPHVRIVEPSLPAASHALVRFVEDSTDLVRDARNHVDRIGDFFSWPRIAARHLQMYRAARTPRDLRHRSDEARSAADSHR